MDLMAEAIKMAHRSPQQKFKTGCIIVKGGKIVSNGWSHIPSIRYRNLRSLHAEMHAIGRGRHLDLRGATFYIATINGMSGNVVMSRPCLHCGIAIDQMSAHAYYTVTLGVTARFVLQDIEIEQLKVYLPPRN